MTLNKRILAVLALTGLVAASAYADSCVLNTLKTDKTILANFTVANDSDGGLKLTPKTGDGMAFLTTYAKTNKCDLFVLSGSDVVKGLNLKLGNESKSSDTNQLLLLSDKKMKELNTVNLNLGAKKITAEGTVVSAQVSKKAK